MHTLESLGVIYQLCGAEIVTLNLDDEDQVYFFS